MGQVKGKLAVEIDAPDVNERHLNAPLEAQLLDVSAAQGRATGQPDCRNTD